MRVLKIILASLSAMFFCFILYITFIEERETVGASFEVSLYTTIALITSLLNIIYHIQSFRFYRSEEKQNLAKKLPKILWVGTISFSAFLLYLAGRSLYSFVTAYHFSGSKGHLVSAVIFLAPSLLGFLEILILKKRIKRLKATLETKDEINTIGNSTL